MIRRVFTRKLGARVWDFFAPAVWLALLLFIVSVAGHFWSGRLPAGLVRAIPALKSAAPDCGRHTDDPWVPANAYRTLGTQGLAQPDMMLVFVHGYHGTSKGWEIVARALDYELQQRNQAALAFFACYPSQDITAFDDAVKVLHEARLFEHAPAGKRIYFIGHSFGGVVLKRYLMGLGPEVDASRIAAITINSPHHGTPASVLGSFTGESLLSEMALSRDLSVFSLPTDRGARLEELNDLAALARFPFYTITGTYVTSPVSAFMGGTFIGQSDGVVPARSAHLVIPSALPMEPKTYIDGLPYFCGVVDRGGARREWQFTFTRPLHQADVFHHNIPDSPTVQRILMRILENPRNLSAYFQDCAPVEPFSVDQYRWKAMLLLLVPFLLLVLGARRLTRYLRESGQGLMTVLYALAGSLCTYVLSYFLPLGIYLVFPGEDSLSGVWMAYIQAFLEETVLMLWFAYFLRQNHDREEYEHQESFVYALLFGFTVAMVEQALFIWATGGSLPGIALLRLIFASLPRMGFAWVAAWVFLQRRRVAALGASPRLVGLTRLALLVLPPTLHTVYSALFFHVTAMSDAVALFIGILVISGAVAGSAALQARQRSGKNALAEAAASEERD